MIVYFMYKIQLFIQKHLSIHACNIQKFFFKGEIYLSIFFQSSLVKLFDKIQNYNLGIYNLLRF